MVTESTPTGSSTVERMVSAQKQKPPLGLVPAYFSSSETELERAKEIAAAITRYADSGTLVPPEWCWELCVRLMQIRADER